MHHSPQLTVVLAILILTVLSGCGTKQIVTGVGEGPTEEAATKAMLSNAREVINRLNPTFELYPLGKLQKGTVQKRNDADPSQPPETVWRVVGKFEARPPR